MVNDSTLISSADFDRLLEVLDQEGARFDTSSVELLDQKLAHARVVEPRDMPASVVTMNSRVRYERPDGSGSKEVSIVYPSEASPAAGRISVLSPIGVSLLGGREGDERDLGARSSAARVRITQITYQPEASGHWHL
jgi:regulator of nucleoside diphosphate kinase